jgi:hypothetical protein
MNMSIKKLFMGKKVVVIGATVALTLGLSGAAYAWYSSTGGGSGTATAGGSTTLVLSSTGTFPSLVPGGPSVWVPVSIHNPGPANEYVGSITGVVQDNGDCLGSWFSVGSYPFNTVVLAGSTSNSGDAVQLNEANVNQSVCEGATMTIIWSSN